MEVNHSVFINGHWLPGEGDVLTSSCPFTQTVIWEKPSASLGQLEMAVTSAHQAFSDWSQRAPKERYAFVRKFAELVQQQKNKGAELIAKETGKPLWEAQTEIAAMIGKIEIAITAYETRSGDHQSQETPTAILTHRPHGVLAVLGPFNFPGHLPNGHIVPALIAGNTVIFKPSEETPAVAEWVMRLWQAINLPKGVLQLLPGGRKIGDALVMNPNVNGILFTGSYQTGCKIHRALGGQPEKMLALEMGGNNPLIIDHCKDNDAALYYTLVSAFITSGQRCTAARRLLLPKNDFGEQFLAQLIKKTENLKVDGYNVSPAPFMGPVINANAADRCLAQQAALKQLGARIIKPLEKIKEPALLSPGILLWESPDEIPDEEIFGPLLQVTYYQDFEEAVKIANQTRYGLSAGLLSDNSNHFNYFWQNIRAGIVNRNQATVGASSHLPFGGIGTSGNHHPSGFYAADYCAYPMASQQQTSLTMPEKIFPGIDVF